MKDSLPTACEVVVCEDVEDLSRRAADQFATLANLSARSEGRFNVCLAGGNTPQRLYSLLSAEPFRSQIPWPLCHFFWGDERCVPPDHADSNRRMAQEALLSKVPVPEANIHRMPAEKEPEAAAREYEVMVQKYFRLGASGFPRFDLVLLGLGDDGHTASLFPENEAVAVRDRIAIATYVVSLKAYRLTLTVAVFNEAANVFFLVSGPSKAAAVARVLRPGKDEKPLPAQRIRPRQGRLVWFLDRAAAQGLNYE